MNTQGGQTNVRVVVFSFYLKQGMPPV